MAVPDPLLLNINAAAKRAVPPTVDELVEQAKVRLTLPILGSRSVALEWLTMKAVGPFQQHVAAFVAGHVRNKEPLPTSGKVELTFDGMAGRGKAILHLDDDMVEVRQPLSAHMQSTQRSKTIELGHMRYDLSESNVMMAFDILSRPEDLRMGGQPLDEAHRAAYNALDPSKFEPSRPLHTLSQWGGTEPALAADRETNELVFVSRHAGLAQSFKDANAL